MSDLVPAALVAGIVVAFLLAAFIIYPNDHRPTDSEAPRRDRLYWGIVAMVAVSFPILIFDHFKVARWLIPWW